MPPVNVIYEFAGRRLDPQRRQLTQAGRVVTLFPRCFDALLLLVERRGELLDKELLMRELWPGTVVDENSLAKVISELRRALGEGSRDGGCILTVPRRGYQFGADVTVHLVNGVPDATARADAAAAEIRALAVLPFTFLNPAAADEYLGLGLADALITRLGVLRRTRVRPTSSIARFAAQGLSAAAAGRALEVDAVITGTIRRADTQVRVGVQLVAVRDEAVVWADKFDCIARDAHELEDSIAERVAAALTLALARDERGPSPRRPAANADAYEQYVRGRYLVTKRTRESLDEAVGCFERAIGIDPGFALAWAGLGETWVYLGIRAAVTQSYQPREVMPKARNAAEKALALDESLSDAHAVLGHVLFVYEWKREAGVAALRRAIELNPSNQNAHHWLALCFAGLGRFDEALAQLGRALEIDPLSIIVHANIGFVLYRAGRTDEAVEKLRHAAAIEPTFVMTRYRLGLALEEQGHYEEAIEQFEAMRPSAQEPLGLTAIARTYALMGRRDTARKLLAELLEIGRTIYVPGALIADVYMGLEDFDGALHWLERAVEERALVSMWLPWDRHWDPLRSNPRFQELVRTIGLDAIAVSRGEP